LFIGGRFLGVIGWQMMQVALGWELYERTHSAFALGLVGLATALPVAVFALPAGHVADRYDRKAVLVWAQIFFAVASFSLAVISHFQGPIPLIYVILILRGTAQAFNNPARQALLPRLVPAGMLTNAVTWASSAFQSAAAIGPALGGFAVAIQGRASGAYVVSAVLFVVNLVTLLMMRGGRSTSSAPVAMQALVVPVGSPLAGGEGVQSEPPWRERERMTLESLVAGMRFVRETKVILAAITLDLFAVLLGGATALLPVFAKDILHVGPDGLGWLRAAPSVGALIIAIGIAHRPPMQRTGWTLLLSVAGFGIATIVFGLSRSYALSVVMLFALGGLDSISMVIRSTLVQLWTPDEMRGRVSAVNSVFIDMSNELGGFESGALAAIVGPVVAVVAGGIGTLVVVTGVAMAWPELRRLKEIEGVPSG
jgi:MFS family permease